MTRVLIVDDSALMRKLLTDQLVQVPDIRVIGTAIDPYAARDKIVRLQPDVVTLDLEMPRMDGLSFLQRLMRHYPLPVVIVSSIAPADSRNALRALELGAIEVISKPNAREGTAAFGRAIVRAVRAAAAARVVVTRPDAPVAPLPPLRRKTADLIAIGASTGGTRAIETLLRSLPANTPGTVIVQHMPAHFTAQFANRLNEHAVMRVQEARDGDVVQTGVALIAPGGRHMIVTGDRRHPIVRLKDGPPVHHQRPAVDVLFDSIARASGIRAVGALLTGMGADGARGLLEMRRAGAYTIAEAESSCVVYGMPREAARLGAACAVIPLDGIARALLSGLDQAGAADRSKSIA